MAAGLILVGGSLTVADVGVASAGNGATTEQWRGRAAGVFVPEPFAPGPSISADSAIDVCVRCGP